MENIIDKILKKLEDAEIAHHQRNDFYGMGHSAGEKGIAINSTFLAGMLKEDHSSKAKSLINQFIKGYKKGLNEYRRDMLKNLRKERSNKSQEIER